MLDLEDQRDESNNQKSESEQICICNHIAPPFTIAEAMDLGEQPPTVYGDTRENNSTICKRCIKKYNNLYSMCDIIVAL